MLLPPERPVDLLPGLSASENDRSDRAGRPRPSRAFRLTFALVGGPLILWGLMAEPSDEPGSPRSLRTAGVIGLTGGDDGSVIADHALGTTALGSEPARAETELQSGESLDHALDRLGLAVPERRDLIGALRERVDLRRLPPATGLVALRDGEGTLVSLALRTEHERYVRVPIRGDAVGPAETVALEGSTLVETAGGAVSRSLSQALAAHRHGGELALAVADLFQWDFDPLSDPRPGDQVRVVFEVRRLTDVPTDLPPYRDAARRPGDELGVGRILAATYSGARARASAFWVEDGQGSGRYFDDRGESLEKAFLRSPLTYRRISSYFSKARRHPVTRKVVPHHGVDFAAPTGTPVVAAADGRVTRAGWKGALGRSIRLRHGAGYETVYGHLSRLATGIRPGAEVHQGQVIGFVGATGRATGPHLHYTLIERGRPIDPLGMRNPQSEPADETMLARLARSKTTWAPLLGSIPTPAELAVGAPAERPGAAAPDAA